MTSRERERFDALLERVIGDLPPRLHDLIAEVPVIVLDRPTAQMLTDLGLDPSSEDDALSLCGLHTGTAFTERSIDTGSELPSDVHIFREGILDLVGGWDGEGGEPAVETEIRITLLHEIGHQFGLDEEDLEDLGYE